MRKTRIQELREEGHRSARAIMALREQPESFLATVQIGITVISATAGAFGGSTLALRLTPLLEHLGIGAYAASISFVLVIVLVSYLSLILGELVPKSLALKFTERYAMLLSRPLLWLSFLARPLVWILTKSSNLILGLFHDKTNFSESKLSAEELRQLVEEAARAGSLEHYASEIASRAFEFGELTVAQIAIPRAKMDSISISATREELKKILVDKTHSRFPVYQESIDNIVGYVTIKDLLQLLFVNEEAPLKSILREAYFTPPSALATHVLRELQRRRTQLAIIYDEHGGLFGLLTAENIIEDLIGNVSNEHEAIERPIQQEADGSYLIKGATPLRSINRALRIELEEGKGHTTLGGLVIMLAGSIPALGAQLTAPDGTILEVLETDPKSVKIVRVRLPKKQPETNE